MAQYTPDGTLLEVLDEGKQETEQQKPNGTPQREGDCGGTGNGQGDGDRSPPYHMRGCGGQGGPGGACECGGTREYDPDPPGLPNILDQLVAALHDASLEGNP